MTNAELIARLRELADELPYYDIEIAADTIAELDRENTELREAAKKRAHPWLSPPIYVRTGPITK